MPRCTGTGLPSHWGARRLPGGPSIPRARRAAGAGSAGTGARPSPGPSAGLRLSASGRWAARWAAGSPCWGGGSASRRSRAGGCGGGGVLRAPWRVRGWAAGPGRGVRRAVQAAVDAAGAPALTAAAAAAAAALGKSRRSGAGVGGERGWTRREEPARSRCPQPGSLRESLSHGRRSAGPASEEEEEERGSGGAAGARGEAAAAVAPFHPQGFWSQSSSPVAAWGVPPLFGERSYPPGPTRAARPGSPPRTPVALWVPSPLAEGSP